jgi:hypothetical protein
MNGCRRRIARPAVRREASPPPRARRAGPGPPVARPGLSEERYPTARPPVAGSEDLTRRRASAAVLRGTTCGEALDVLPRNGVPSSGGPTLRYIVRRAQRSPLPAVRPLATLLVCAVLFVVERCRRWSGRTDARPLSGAIIPGGDEHPPARHGGRRRNAGAARGRIASMRPVRQPHTRTSSETVVCTRPAPSSAPARPAALPPTYPAARRVHTHPGRRPPRLVPIAPPSRVAPPAPGRGVRPGGRRRPRRPHPGRSAARAGPRGRAARRGGAPRPTTRPTIARH